MWWYQFFKLVGRRPLPCVVLVFVTYTGRVPFSAYTNLALLSTSSTALLILPHLPKSCRGI